MELELAVKDCCPDQRNEDLDSNTAHPGRPCRAVVPADQRRSGNALRIGRLRDRSDLAFGTFTPRHRCNS